MLFQWCISCLNVDCSSCEACKTQWGDGRNVVQSTLIGTELCCTLIALCTISFNTKMMQNFVRLLDLWVSQNKERLFP
jgi:hypothetical protein